MKAERYADTRTFAQTQGQSVDKVFTSPERFGRLRTFGQGQCFTAVNACKPLYLLASERSNIRANGLPNDWRCRMIGHNGYSFDDVVQENLECGLYWAQRDCLIRAVRDPELSHRHRIVIAEIIAMTNAESGVAYPGRKHLAAATGYTEGTIATTIKELVALGYIISDRRAPENGTRALAHYAIVKPTSDELRAAIDAHISFIRAASDGKAEIGRPWSKVNNGVHVNTPPWVA